MRFTHYLYTIYLSISLSYVRSLIIPLFLPNQKNNILTIPTAKLY